MDHRRGGRGQKECVFPYIPLLQSNPDLHTAGEKNTKTDSEVQGSKKPFQKAIVYKDER